MTEQQILIKGYDNTDFLAEKLKKVFSQIKSDADKALHNDMMFDIQTIIGPHAEGFRHCVAQVIIGIGQRNYGKKAEEKTPSAAAQRLG